MHEWEGSEDEADDESYLLREGSMPRRAPLKCSDRYYCWQLCGILLCVALLNILFFGRPVSSGSAAPTRTFEILSSAFPPLNACAEVPKRSASEVLSGFSYSRVGDISTTLQASRVSVLKCRAEEADGTWEVERVGPFVLEGGVNDMHSFSWRLGEEGWLASGSGGKFITASFLGAVDASQVCGGHISQVAPPLQSADHVAQRLNNVAPGYLGVRPPRRVYTPRQRALIRRSSRSSRALILRVYSRR